MYHNDEDRPYYSSALIHGAGEELELEFWPRGFFDNQRAEVHVSKTKFAWNTPRWSDLWRLFWQLVTHDYTELNYFFVIEESDIQPLAHWLLRMLKDKAEGKFDTEQQEAG